MLPCRSALRSLSLQPRLASNARHSFQRHSQRRHLLQAASQGFLDLAIALPLPPSLPAYSTAIILATILSRTALLPFYVWSQKRRWRFEEQVVPQIEQAKSGLAQVVLADMKKDGVRGEVDFLRAEHAKRMKETLTELQKKLLKQYNCGPRATVLVPALTQIPVFIAMSALFARIAAVPTPLDSESFMTLTTLAHTDPTMVLPVVVGMLTMANVEASSWFLSAEQLAKQKEHEEKTVARAREQGKPPIVFSKIFKTTMRGLSVFRILITSVMPGSVVIYWLTSSAFGLAQTVVFNLMDQRRKLRLKAAQPSASSSTAPSTAQPSISSTVTPPTAQQVLRAVPPLKTRKASKRQ